MVVDVDAKSSEKLDPPKSLRLSPSPTPSHSSAKASDSRGSSGNSGYIALKGHRKAPHGGVKYGPVKPEDIEVKQNNIWTLTQDQPSRRGKTKAWAKLKRKRRPPLAHRIKRTRGSL
ncbi:hypothetical protein N7504_005871 [Penicillium tannophilum]|nr:hypothetical protein N7504_005871 [Penicillium tannophilum]